MAYKATMVTTVDNPFDPFDDFEHWNRWDQDHGYNTWSYLLRVAKLSDSMSERESDDEISAASEEIAYFNLTGKYKKVSKMIEETDI